MKKIFIFAFVLALAFSLCACACSKSTSDPTGTTPTAKATVMPTTEMTIPVPETNIPDSSINTEPTHMTDNTIPGSDATIAPRNGILR